MTKVWVLSAITVEDTEGSVIDTGHVIGVYATEELAEAAKQRRIGFRKDHDFSIENLEVNS